MERFERFEFIDQIIDFLARIGAPSGICAALLYEIHRFFTEIIIGQVTIIKNQELILELLRRALYGK